jgi:DNA-binding LacI/PurR family transcriptional regulator
MARVTLQTIADTLGVSRMTVSNAFSRPDQLSADLRAQVLAVAERLGYVGPNPAARGLARGTVGNIGLLLSESLNYALTDHVAVAFLAAIADELGPTGRALTLLPSVNDAEFVPARDIALDGAVIYSCIPNSPDVRWLERRKLPLVFVDNIGPRGYPSVTIDDQGGARDAAQLLIDLGHRNIAIVSNGVEGDFGVVSDIPDRVTSFPERERLRGWQGALGTAGIKPLLIRTEHGDPVTAGETAGKQLFDHVPRPTGVLCFSDALATGVLRAARAAGLSVPADVSIVGFDDSPLARQLDPDLTTVRQDVTAKGRAAAAALIQQIAPVAKARPKRRVSLPTELVVRGSTGPAPAR